jgi:hypothetical protein
MRYNPPPNWPAPPEGWEPPPGWSPDPSWPPPPSDWKFWVEDAPVSQVTQSVQHRILRSREDVEYFGDDRAWSADSERATSHESHEQLNPRARASLSQPTEFAPEDLSAHQLGLRATIRWESEHRYDIGTIVAISADSAAISVELAGLGKAISFLREIPPSGPANPRLYVWI